ncbi:MAG: AAA family ATPase [Candidatus Omnitrophota bacterium]
MNLDYLLELDKLARDEGRKYSKRRELYAEIVSQKGKHFTGIVGSRGVGKTVLLKQIAIQAKNSFYLSADTIKEGDLFEIIKILIERYRIKLLLLDEIHFQKEYQQVLKKVFDFLEVKLIFTSSVSLSIFESSYDLSRRVKLFYLHPFSFREYLFFKEDISLAPLSLDQIIKKQWPKEYLRYQYLFKDYLKGGLFPFSLQEPDIYPILENILQKIIRKDIPSVAGLQVDELDTINKVLKFIGRSPVDGINFSSLSKNIGITKYKAEQYINLLSKAFVLNPVFPKGTNVLKEPKVIMYLPFRLIYKSYDQAIGAIREDFFVEVMRIKGWNFNYLKTKRGKKTPDFLMKLKDKNIVLEVGGKSKGRRQFKGIKQEEKIILTDSLETEGIKRPLFLMGFL